MLVNECEKVNVEVRLNCQTLAVQRNEENALFELATSDASYNARNLIVATGGLSIPTLGGATGFGYQLATQFGLDVHATEASLVPMTLSGKWHEFSAALSGVSIPVLASVKAKSFSESLLFTHRGLSGPSILQLSNYWQLGEIICIDLLPSTDLHRALIEKKQQTPQSTINQVLNQYFPKSLLNAFQQQWWDLNHCKVLKTRNSKVLQIKFTDGL